MRRAASGVNGNILNRLDLSIPTDFTALLQLYEVS